MIEFTKEQYDYLDKHLTKECNKAEIRRYLGLKHSTFYILINKHFPDRLSGFDRRTSEEVEKRVIELLPHHKNKEICKIVGIGEGTLNRIVKRYGIDNSLSSKSDDYSGEKQGWKKAQQTRTAESYKRASKKISELRRTDTIRKKYGLKPKTKLRTNDNPMKRKIWQYGYILRKRGYIVDGITAYYTEQTNRMKTEEKRKHGFRFYPYGVKRNDVVTLVDWSDKQGGFNID